MTFMSVFFFFDILRFCTARFSKVSKDVESFRV